MKWVYWKIILDAISMTETVINVAMSGCKKRARDNK